jgi:hypothetical protein
LGKVSLACNRRTAFFEGKKLDQCFHCMQENVVKAGSGPVKVNPSANIELISKKPIESSDLSLIGRSWSDRQDGLTFTLLGIKWTLLDSDDGENLLTLVGTYASDLSVSVDEREWSSMVEIRDGFLMNP